MDAGERPSVESAFLPEPRAFLADMAKGGGQGEAAFGRGLDGALAMSMPLARRPGRNSAFFWWAQKDAFESMTCAARRLHSLPWRKRASATSVAFAERGPWLRPPGSLAALASASQGRAELRGRRSHPRCWRKRPRVEVRPGSARRRLGKTRPARQGKEFAQGLNWPAGWRARSVWDWLALWQGKAGGC